LAIKTGCWWVDDYQSDQDMAIESRCNYYRRALSFLLFSSIWVFDALHSASYAAEFAISAPDTCENGAVCPVEVSMNPPLLKGDTFLLRINEEEATRVQVLDGDLSHFGARFITPRGLSKVVVTCGNCAHRSAEKQIRTNLSRTPSVSNSAPKSIRLRGTRGDLRALVESEDTVSGYAFFDTSTSKILVKQTPFTVKNPYFGIKGSFAEGNNCFAFQSSTLMVQCTAGLRGLSIPPTQLASLVQLQMNTPVLSSATPGSALRLAQVPRPPESPRSTLSLTAAASQPDGNGVVTLTISTNSDTASLKVNGDEAGARADGRYTVKRFAQVGANSFEVIATDRFGNTQRKIVTVSRAVEEIAARIQPLNPIRVSESKPRDAVAIIIGIEKYKSVGLASFADKDARVFYDYARRALGVRAENIKLLVDEKADAAEILVTFKNWLPARVKTGSTDVYVFYSGHGLPSEDGSSLYLLPHEARTDLLERTAISQSELVAAIQKSSPKSVTMFLDSCYSGQSRTGETLLASARPISVKAKQSTFPKNFTVISASAPDQYSYSSPDLRHGIFSYYLMRGMEGEADTNKDKQITVAEMQTYLSVNVTRRAMGMNRTQQPQVVGDQSRVLVGK
jgi:hypothetical protein